MSERRRKQVVIIGGATGLGRLLAGRLHRSYRLTTVDGLGFDERPRDIDHMYINMRSKRSRNRLFEMKPHAVIHVGYHELELNRKPQFIDRKSVAHQIEWIASVEPNKVLYFSSSELYGATVDTVGYINESFPLTAASMTSSFGQAAQADLMMQTLFWRAPKTQTTILRPVSLVGPYQKTWLTQMLKKRHVISCLGFDPLVQLLHTDDLYTVVDFALKKKLPGVFNAVGPGVIPWSRLIAARGSVSLDVPEFLIERALKMRGVIDPGQSTHAIKRFLKYDLLVNGSRLQRHMKWEAERSLLGTATGF